MENCAQAAQKYKIEKKGKRKIKKEDKKELISKISI